MVFLDINTFFSPKAGGIRTYHQAKIAWFQRQMTHKYLLVHPGLKKHVHSLGPQVTLIRCYGPAATSDPAGYRILFDYIRVLGFVLREKPQVLEAGDPWLTGLFCLFIKKIGLYRGLLVSFYHSDPIPSYLIPWASRGRAQGLKKLLLGPLSRLFYGLQRHYDLTAVSSQAMQDNLRSRGIFRVALLPFGVPVLFLEDKPPTRFSPGSNGCEARVLYAGRLDREKGIELVLEILPKLLGQGNVKVTVMGRGSFSGAFSAIKHPNFAFLGFVDDPVEVKRIYDAHDVLLAPGPFETFGLGVLEGMARGLVVIGPNKGGTGELLRQAESPFLFSADDCADFERKVAAALACDWESERARSVKLAARYGTWDDSVGRMVALYSAKVASGAA